jgi:hypothetical protein
MDRTVHEALFRKPVEKLSLGGFLCLDCFSVGGMDHDKILKNETPRSKLRGISAKTNKTRA